jgi:predicted DNA-binding protein (UPF0251 family)
VLLLSIARRAVTDAIRREQRHPRSRPVAEVPSRSAPDHTGHVDVQHLIAALDEPLRQAFVLTQVIGLSYEEAADAAGVRIGTIRSRVHRARERLVAAMGPGGPRPPHRLRPPPPATRRRAGLARAVRAPETRGSAGSTLIKKPADPRVPPSSPGRTSARAATGRPDLLRFDLLLPERYHTVRNGAEERVVVGDGEDAQPAGACAGEEHVPDLRLGDRVEHGADLVGDEVARACGERPGDGDALELPTAQLVGEAIQPPGGDGQRLEERGVGRAGLAEDVAQPPARVDGELGCWKTSCAGPRRPRAASGSPSLRTVPRCGVR